MRNPSVPFLIFLVVLVVAGVAVADPPDRTAVVVQFTDNVKSEDIAAWIGKTRSSDLRIDYRFHTFPAVLVSAPVEKAALFGSLAADPIVTHVGGDTPVDLAYTPNDPLFGGQWWADNNGSQGNPHEDIDAVRAWDTTTGGSEVVVAIIDYGVDISHPDLAANCLTGYDFVLGVPGVPPHFHGTACAGLIGAIGDNAEGIAGVNWDITIVPFRMYTVAHCAAAIDSATAMGVDVINNSWSIGGDQPELTAAITAATKAGVIVVNSAGNNGWDLDIPGNEKYPASYDLPLNLAVANSGSNGLLAGDSNWGLDTVELAAPGSYVLSCAPDSSYCERSGTSFSAPIVAGAVAMLKHQYPAADPEWIVDRMVLNAEELFHFADRISNGRRLNIYRMLNTDDRTPPSAIANLQVVDLDYHQATLTWTAPGDDGMVGQLDRYEIWSAGFGNQILIGTVPVSPGQTQTVTLEDLNYSTEFTVEIVAVDEARNRSAHVSTTFTTLDPPEIVMPEVFELVYATTGEVVEASTWVYNTGEGTLEVGVVGGGNTPWLTITPAEFVVAENDSVEVVFTINASGICSQSLSAALQFTHNDPYHYPVAYNLIVVMTPAQEISGPAGTVDFGEVPIYAIASKKIVVRNIGCTSLSISNIGMQYGTYFSVSAAPRVVQPGGSTVIQVSFTASQLGIHNDVLLIASNSPFMPILEIPVQGECVDGLGKALALEQGFTNTPNPFNPQTEFRFVSEVSGDYRITVYDLRGAVIRQIEGAATAGTVTQVSWSGVTDQGRAVPSGVYFCTLQINGRRVADTLKVNLVR